MIDLGRCGMFVPATPGTARRHAQVSQCIRLNLIGEYKDRGCPCSSIRMCPFKDEELNEFRAERTADVDAAGAAIGSVETKWLASKAIG